MDNTNNRASMNQQEMEIHLKLMQLKKDNRQIYVSLSPPEGETTIQPDNNRMSINEGREGTWIGVSGIFYDAMAKTYDFRG